MKKSTIFILSAIFIIMILFIPNRIFAAPNGATLIVDYDNSNFQDFYSTNIESRLDLIIERCRTVTQAENVLIGYSKTPFSPYTDDVFVCYNVDFTEDINAFVSDTGTSSSYLRLEFPTTKYRLINVSDLSTANTLSTTYRVNSFYASSYDSLLNEFTTDFIPDNSNDSILFYNDKDNIVFSNNEDNGLFINGTYVQYGEKITLYANSEKSFLPEDYDYIDYVINSDDLITSANITLKFPVLSEYVPYTFTYNSYFVLDDEPDVQHFLDGGTYTVTSDYVGYTNELLVERKYNLYSYATYYFEVYDALKPNNKVLLQVESFHTDNTGNIYIGDSYIDDNNKDNTANILGGSIFSNFKTSDYGFTAILTAPLRLVKSFDSSVCTAPVIPILGTDFTLPCGQTFWNREDITDFKEIYQIIVYGLLCYYLGIDIIRTIQDLKNPGDSRLNVIDL